MNTWPHGMYSSMQTSCHVFRRVHAYSWYTRSYRLKMGTSGVYFLRCSGFFWRVVTIENVARVPRYPDDYLNLIASKLKDRTAWGDLRNARFAKLLQFSLGRYFKGGLNMCRAVVAGLTKVLYKVSAQHESIGRSLNPSVISHGETIECFPGVSVA